MIIAGDYIDSTLGVTFHISVLAAAALGNTMSDLVGIFFGGYVELLADRMGLPQPKFSPAEADSIYARVAKNGGQGKILRHSKYLKIKIKLLESYLVVFSACSRFYL